MTSYEALQEECARMRLRVAELEEAAVRTTEAHEAALAEEREAHAAARSEIDALRRNQAMLQGLLDALPDIVFAKDSEWKYVVANKAFDDFFRMGRAQTLGKTDYEVFPEKVADTLRAFDIRVLSLGTPLEQHEVVPSGEEIRTYRSYKFPLTDAGAVCGLGGIATDITERQRHEAELSVLQGQVIEAQRAALRELSTPMIPLSSNAVLLPLIGTIDAERAQQAMETLLDGIGRHGARVAILDITGVRTVDNLVADALVRTARAAKLLGAEVVLTGIQPSVAQLLVQLGIELGGITTRGTLQDGIAYAIGR